MIIRKPAKRYVPCCTLICDICGSKAPEQFCTHADAVDWMKRNGWANKKVDGEWENVCEKCLEGK